MVRRKLRLIRPPALAEGDLIGLAAPAGPFPLDRFEAGRARIETLGFKTFSPRQVFERQDYLAGSDRNRIRTFTALAGNKRVSAIMAIRGGYGSLRLLDRLDLGMIQERPKIIIGFSDLTALLLHLYRTVGLVTFHGPMAASLAEADEDTAGHLRRLITGQRVFPLPLEAAGIIKPGRAEGYLLGGNLTMIVHLLAAGRLPDLKDAILFLEDTGEAPYRLDRMLTTLRLAGILDRLRGLIFGRFEDCGTQEEIDRVLRLALVKFAGPVVTGFPLGHGRRNLALPLGPLAVLDTRAGLLDLLEPYLS
ncbi:MAG: LD-carboxypeptidase [Thermodesulfobacteriota bacterium]